MENNVVEEASLKKGIVIVLMVNILNLLLRLLLNFMMPKYMHVDVYADYKFYQLLVGYIGMLHFGYVDGVYIKFGGKNIKGISEEEIGRSLTSLLVMEVIVTGIVVIIGIITHQPTVLIAATAIIPTEIMWLFQYIYQATGEFKKYGSITSLNIVLLFTFISFLMLCGSQNSYLYMGAYSLVMLIIATLLQLKSGIRFKKKWFNYKSIIDTCINNIKIGVFVMIGNFASQLLTSMDRWFIKLLMTPADFAQYSFAASLEAFLSVAISPFSVTLYNFFCRYPSKEEVKKIEEQIYVFAVMIIGCAFPAKWILEHFIPKYLSASDVMFYLFASKGFNIVIVCIFVNLYKAMKMQHAYSKKIVFVLVTGFVTNISMYYLLRTKEAFAIATLITIFIWFLFCKIEFRQYRLSVQAEAYLILEIAMFIVIGKMLDSVIGFVGYYLITVVLSLLLMRKASLSIISTVIGVIRKRTNM